MTYNEAAFWFFAVLLAGLATLGLFRAAGGRPEHFNNGEDK